jgi:two-component system response regulator FixJ
MLSEGVVYIVDDEEPIRTALSLLLKTEGLNSKAYATAQAFLDGYDKNTPSCLVLDVRMPEMSGLELQESLLSEGIDIPIIFMTANGDIPSTVRAMKGGARDFIQKPFENHHLLETIQKHLEQEIKGWQQKTRQSDIKKRLTLISPREHDVLKLLVKGLQSKQIGMELGIGIRTVESHRAHIMDKLQITSVAQLVQIL